MSLKCGNFNRCIQYSPLAQIKSEKDHLKSIKISSDMFRDPSEVIINQPQNLSGQWAPFSKSWFWPHFDPCGIPFKMHDITPKMILSLAVCSICVIWFSLPPDWHQIVTFIPLLLKPMLVGDKKISTNLKIVTDAKDLSLIDIYFHTSLSLLFKW